MNTTYVIYWAIYGAFNSLETNEYDTVIDFISNVSYEDGSRVYFNGTHCSFEEFLKTNISMSPEEVEKYLLEARGSGR